MSETECKILSFMSRLKKNDGPETRIILQDHTHPPPSVGQRLNTQTVNSMVEKYLDVTS